MKIRTKLAIAFLTITVVPITLIYMAIIGLNNYQARVFSETYGVSEDVDLFHPGLQPLNGVHPDGDR